MRSRSKSAREQQERKELLGRMRRGQRFVIYYRGAYGDLVKGRWENVIPAGWYAADRLGEVGWLGPFKTEKRAKAARNLLRRKAEAGDKDGLS